ncbi:MAG TPA: hypothetical protein VFB21_17425 [Chthonomonadaceae bacterium]|nr:hypothetical protein [Chthonomonadaceae bacterium]
MTPVGNGAQNPPSGCVGKGGDKSDQKLLQTDPALFLLYSDRFLLEKQSQNHYFSLFFARSRTPLYTNPAHESSLLPRIAWFLARQAPPRRLFRQKYAGR